MGNRKPNKSFDKDGKENNKIRSLQQEIKERDKQIKRLQSELRSLEAAFKKSANYMSKESKQLSVEDLIHAANKEYTLEQAKKEKVAPVSKIAAKFAPPSEEELKQKRQETLERLKQWRKETYGEYEEE